MRFDSYKCDRAVSLGVDMESLARVLRCAAKDDIITGDLTLGLIPASK